MLRRIFILAALVWGMGMPPTARADDAATARDKLAKSLMEGTRHEGNDPAGDVIGVRVFILDDQTAALLAKAYPRLREINALAGELTVAGVTSLKTLAGLQTLEIGEVLLPGNRPGPLPIAQLTQLQTVAVVGRQVNDQGILSLAKLLNLRRLSFPRTKVSDAALAVVKGMSELDELNIQRVKGIGDEGMKYLRGCAKLRMLNLQGTSVTDVGMGDVGSLTTLEELWLPPEITDDGIARLAKLTRLRKLDMGGTDFTGLGTPGPGIWIPRTRGRKGENIGGAAGPVLRENNEPIGIGSGVRPAGSPFDEVPGLPEVGDGGMAIIGAFTELRELNLAGVLLSDQGIRSIAALTKLERLDLSETPVGSTAGRVLREFSKLRSLNLRKTKVDDAAMEDVARLVELEELDLSSTGISDRGLARLKPLLKLRSLELADVKLTAAGVELLRGFGRLDHLNLNRVPGVTDQSLPALASLKNVQSMELRASKITDSGLIRLAELPALKFLHLSGEKLTRAGVQKLERARPGLRIDFRDRPEGEIITVPIDKG